LNVDILLRQDIEVEMGIDKNVVTTRNFVD